MRRRLVHQPQRHLEGAQRGERDATSLTGRQRAHRSITKTARTDTLQTRLDPRTARRSGRCAAHRYRELHVLASRQIGFQRRVVAR
jgi:hypothetical protein